jgi:hypothetical protein
MTSFSPAKQPGRAELKELASPDRKKMYVSSGLLLTYACTRWILFYIAKNHPTTPNTHLFSFIHIIIIIII